MGLKEKIINSIEGISVALIETAIAIPELDITLDCGNPVSKLPRTNNYFISHYHEDHYGGLVKLNEKLEKNVVLYIPLRNPIFSLSISSTEELYQNIKKIEKENLPEEIKNNKIKEITEDFEETWKDFKKFNLEVHPNLKKFNIREVSSEIEECVNQDSKIIYKIFEHNTHRVPSIGICITLKNQLENSSLVYYGDCNIKEFGENEVFLCKNSDIWIAECSFPYKTESLTHKGKWGHSSIYDIKSFITENNIKDKTIILMHLRPDGPKGFFDKQGIINSLEEELKNDKNNEYYFLKSWGKPHKPIKISNNF